MQETVCNRKLLSLFKNSRMKIKEKSVQFAIPLKTRRMIIEKRKTDKTAKGN